MKVYVVKNDKGQYQTPDISFISSLWQADLFNDYEVAKCYCEKDCEIVECELIEKTELTDYTKQVIKEVCEELKDIFNKSQYMSRHNSIDKETLFKILDQIQGETK